MVIWNILNPAISIVALAIATFAALYTRQQVLFLREEKRLREQLYAEDVEWSSRANAVVQKLIGLMPLQSERGPVYPKVIDESNLRGLIESHLVSFDLGRNRVEARTLTPELLRRPLLRDTIQQLEERFSVIRKESPDIALKASL